MKQTNEKGANNFMNTANEATNQLHEALEAIDHARATIADLVTVHDYQDVAGFVAEASAILLQSAIRFMEKDSEAALELIEAAEDAIDQVYHTIDSDLDE